MVERELPPNYDWRRGYYSAADELMNFINALDSSEMSGREVRSAIYGKALEMRPPETAQPPRSEHKGSIR
jgi:hypothetical protein